MKKNSIGFRESEHGAIDVNILICTFPPALHPLGQPSVARPTGFPALRFPTSQNRVEPSPERNERTNPLPHRDRPRIRLDQPIKHLQERHVDSRLPTASHPTGCLWQSTERLPRRLVTSTVMANEPQALMPSPPGVRHLGCTKAFLRNLFFGPSQGPQFPPA